MLNKKEVSMNKKTFILGLILLFMTAAMAFAINSTRDRVMVSTWGNPSLAGEAGITVTNFNTREVRVDFDVIYIDGTREEFRDFWVGISPSHMSSTGVLPKAIRGINIIKVIIL